jgi:hypothetical protein
MYGGPALIPVILKPSLSEKEAAPGRLFLVSLDAAPGGGIRAATPEEIYERVAAATCGQEAEAAGRPWFATMSSTGPDPDGPDEIMLHGRRASLPAGPAVAFRERCGRLHSPVPEPASPRKEVPAAGGIALRRSRPGSRTAPARGEAAVLLRAERLDIGGLVVPVPVTSDLILLKLAAGGPIDLQDVIALVHTDPHRLVPEVDAKVGEVRPDVAAVWERVSESFR